MFNCKTYTFFVNNNQIEKKSILKLFCISKKTPKVVDKKNNSLKTKLIIQMSKFENCRILF